MLPATALSPIPDTLSPVRMAGFCAVNHVRRSGPRKWGDFLRLPSKNPAFHKVIPVRLLLTGTYPIRIVGGGSQADFWRVERADNYGFVTATAGRPLRPACAAPQRQRAASAHGLSAAR